MKKEDIPQIVGALVTLEDHLAGFIELPLRYRAGKTPDGCPEKIRLTAISHLKHLKVLRDAQKSDDPELLFAWTVLIHSLTPPYNEDAFLDRLHPVCVNELAEAALILAQGVPTPGAKKNIAEKQIHSEASAPG